MLKIADVILFLFNCKLINYCFQNAKLISTFLNDHPKVQNVYWPGLKSHENHEIAKKQMDDFGGMVSFNIKGNIARGLGAILPKKHELFIQQNIFQHCISWTKVKKISKRKSSFFISSY